MSMPVKTAIFYAAFGSRIGLGHVVRCAALADVLKSQGWHCVLLLADGLSVPGFLRQSFDRAVELGGFDEAASLLVVDCYAPDPAELKRLSSMAQTVLQISDDRNGARFGDILLNPNADAAGDEAEGPARVLCGPIYALVRAPFPFRRFYDGERPGARQEKLRVLVMPGGTDVQGLSRTLLLEDGMERFDIRIALSSMTDGIDELRKQTKERFSLRLVLDADASELAALMAETDVMICNGGGINWERCAMALPGIMSIAAENQRTNAVALAAGGTALLAEDGSIGEVAQKTAEALNGLLSMPEKLDSMSSCAAQLCDGLGAFRVALEVDPPLSRKGERVTLRPASMADAERLYAWQKQPETRRFARNPDVPTWEEHLSWLSRRLADPCTVLSVIECSGQPAGVVRLDFDAPYRNSPGCEVSINVDSQMASGGIGGAALAAAERLVPFAWKKAYVLEENDRSERLFRGQGYKPVGKGWYYQEPVMPLSRAE